MMGDRYDQELSTYTTRRLLFRIKINTILALVALAVAILSFAQ